MARSLSPGFRRGQDPTDTKFREPYREHDSSCISTKSQKKIETVLKSIENIIGAHWLASVISQHVVKWKAQLPMDPKSERTIASDTAHLKIAINWAKKHGSISKVPVMRKPKRTSTSEAMKGRHIKAEEFDRMIEQVKEPVLSEIPLGRRKHMLNGLWWFGLRLEESLNLLMGSTRPSFNRPDIRLLELRV